MSHIYLFRAKLIEQQLYCSKLQQCNPYPVMSTTYLQAQFHHYLLEGVNHPIYIFKTLHRTKYQIVTFIIFNSWISALGTNTWFSSSMPMCLAMTRNSQLSYPFTFTIFSMEGLMIFDICVMYGKFLKCFVVGIEACERE